MSRRVRILLAVIMTLSLVLGPASGLRPAAAGATVITLTIGSPTMTVNGVSQPIDAGGTTPVIIGGRTLLPIRAVVEAIGGTIEWNAATRTVTITAKAVTMSLTIGNRMATVNGTKLAIDPQNPSVVPVIVGGRTMLPLRFVGEQLGGTVDWDGTTRTATLTFTAPVPLTAPRLMEPADGALFTSATVTFRWTPVEGATSYSLVVISGGKEAYRGTSSATSLTPSGSVLKAGSYAWTVTAMRGTETGPVSLPGRFSVKLPMSPADIVRAATPATAYVVVEYAAGGTGTAGGFFVTSDGMFITTYEVIKGAIGGHVVLSDGSELASLRVLGYDPEADIAVLKVPTGNALPFLSLATATSAQVNQDVVMVGPVVAGVPQYTVAGVVHSVSAKSFIIRGDASRAVEGAPVLDQFGDVIGMVTTEIDPAIGSFPTVSATTIGAVSTAGDWTLAQVTDREGTGLQALDVPILAQPSPEAVIGSLTPDLRWNVVAGATRYELWVGEGRNASGDGIISEVIDFTYGYITPGNLKPGTTYTWTVRAGNQYGWGPWAPDRMFTTSSSIVQPPSPTVLEPLGGREVKSSTLMLFWAPVSGAQRYYVRISLSEEEDVYETSTVNTSILVPQGTLAAGVSYYWKVRVENSSQVSSIWSPDTTFTFAPPSGLGVTTIIMPAPGTVLTALNPTFSWQPVEGATRYSLRIIRSSDNAKVDEYWVSGTTKTIPVGVLQPGATYTASVIAGDATAWSQSGDVWNWCLWRQFTIGTNATAVLVKPILLTPADGASGQSLTPTLSWETVAAAAHYRVFVGIGPDEKHLEQVYQKVVYPKDGATQQLVIPGSTLQPGTTYWWRVIAASGDDAMASDFATFTTTP